MLNSSGDWFNLNRSHYLKNVHYAAVRSAANGAPLRAITVKVKTALVISQLWAMEPEKQTWRYVK